MNLTVYQTIMIHTLRINEVSNASVFQIGSAGVIKPLTQLFNTGGFTMPAPPAGVPAEEGAPFFVPLVTPTPAPGRGHGGA